MKVNVGFTGLLALLFIGLKLGHVIAWPWLWVLAPLWIPLAIGLAIMAVIIFVAVLAAVAEEIDKAASKRKARQ